MSENEDRDKQDAFVLRLNGKILPWALVLFFIAVIARALLAEYRLAVLEYGGTDQENRIRVLEDRPKLPNHKDQ